MVRTGETRNKWTSNKHQVDLARQMSILRAATTTRIDEDLSPTNVTAIHGENALLVCTIQNIGDKSVSLNLIQRFKISMQLLQVSWLRHSHPIPQLLALNNITNTRNPRYKAVVSGGWSEFVLLIKDVKPRDSGVYECQISGPKHSSLNRIITLTVLSKIDASLTVKWITYCSRIHDRDCWGS